MTQILRLGLAVAVLLSLFGCVTTKEYNARLGDIGGLKKDVASLEEKLKQTEAEKAAVSADLAKLQKEYDDLKEAEQGSRGRQCDAE